jgi:GTP-binding protein
LAEKPTLLAINKLDLPQARESFARLQPSFPEIRGISAATGEGVRDLILAVARTIERAPMPDVAAPAPARIELVAPDAFLVERGPDGAFVISGERVERLAAMTNFDSDEGLARFERALERMGVEKRLVELGAAEGDTVRIGPYEFTYS